MASKSSFLQKLRKNSILEILPDLEDLLFKFGEVRLVPAQTIVAAQGIVLTELIIPISAPLSLISINGSSNGTQYLQINRALGLKNLLTGWPLEYQVKTEVTTSLITLNLHHLRELLGAHPHIERYLILMNSSAGLRTFRRFLAENGVEDKDIFRLFARVNEDSVNFSVSDVLTSESNRIYFVNSGFGFALPNNDTSLISAPVNEGAWFGGSGLVAPHKWTYQVKFETVSETFTLEYADVYTILQDANIIEKLYAEPCLDFKESDSGDFDFKLSASFGDLIEAASLVEAVLGADPEKIIRCSTDAESIIATIGNLGLFRDRSVNLSTIRMYISQSRQLTFLRLAEIIEGFGFNARPMRASFEELARHNFPFIVFIGGRYCLVLAATKLSITVLDPAVGFVSLSMTTFTGLWDGTFLEVLDIPMQTQRDKRGANSAESKQESSRSVKYFFIRLLHPHSRTLASIIALSVIGFGLSLLAPIFYQHLLDEVLSLRDERLIVSYVGGILLVTAFTVGIVVVKQLAVAEFAVRYDARLSSLFYQHALSVSAADQPKERIGELLSRLLEIWNIRLFFSGSTINAIVDGFSIIVYALVLFWYSWKVALVSLALFVVVMSVRFLFNETLHRKYAADFEAKKSSRSLLSEQINAIGAVKASGAEETMRGKWEASFLHGVFLRRKIQIINSWIQSMVAALSGLGRLAAIWLSCKLALASQLTAGEILAISMYLDAMIGPIGNLASLFAEVEKVSVSLEKVAETFNTDLEETRENALMNQAVELSGKVRLERVNFRYDKESSWILRDLTMTIYPNQVVAIVGRSGSGKTTLANLIAGGVKPTSGRILYDDFDANFISLTSLRQQIGYVMQSSELFAGSIRDNIALSDDAPDEKLIEDVANRAAAGDFVRSFPAGYSHYLAESGLGLSGGQKQRISIARALYRNPKILIMDEATSALDAESERRIVESMKEILSGRTAIVIAHRLSTIRDADHIIVIHDGQIVEQGKHLDLIRAGGHYTELFETQVASGEI